MSCRIHHAPCLILVLAHDPQDKVHYNGAKQGNCQDGRAETVVETALASLPYALRAPVEGNEGIGHGSHGNEGEQAGADLADLVAKVEQADGETAEDDGKVQPGEECALVGEEDFGLDAGGQGDALAWKHTVSRMEVGWVEGAVVPGAVWRSG